MKRNVSMLLFLFILTASPPAFGDSPLPTFDKEAVETYPYMRTGDMNIMVDDPDIRPPAGYRGGNTGTEDEPAFFVRSIRLTGYQVLRGSGLDEILARYSGRNVKVKELPLLTAAITEYCRERGYTIPLAAIPEQEVKDGVLEVRIYTATYDGVEITANSSDIYDKTLRRYVSCLKRGDVITDRRLETAVNNLNDLPGVQARAVLKPGSKPGTTKIDIEVRKRKVWNNYVFADNGGSEYSGRYRFGFNTEINNPSRTGDKIIISGMITDEETKNYSVRYETPLGSRGTRAGVAFSQTNYDFANTAFSAPGFNLDSSGESRGVSVYGMTPLYRSKAARVTLIYGYDRRDIEEELRWREYGLKLSEADKDANVWHIGITGSCYEPNEFLQYSLVYWYGDISTDGGAYYDGSYQKLTADFLKIWYAGRFNYRIRAKGQLASRALDGSEQFFLGGINGVRAYANGDGYGDTAYTATGEVRYGLGVPGLELAAFIDAGAAKNLESGVTDHLAGWGVGLRYSKPNDWHAQLDYAHKIDGRPDRTEEGDDDGRIWFQLYKMF
ncbi:ShlB/FhaC/HecB family hemolysin secretion/activation protein [Cloacibacillus sp. An23]|uniref:ShlB/FhaC/HecB family hemolysin secretion/activation protein n=1 Tax=Cloacibacillus sp. An23 TaxID=1965591 RepID=UPI0011779CE0|nr:ShlB/FhaC/HecB family hemolysin secretion/activation protein [Cloacibacillus sp. An23]